MQIKKMIDLKKNPLFGIIIINNNDYRITKIEEEIIEIESSDKLPEIIDCTVSLLNPQYLLYKEFHFTECKVILLKEEEYTNIYSIDLNIRKYNFYTEFMKILSDLYKLSDKDFSCIANTFDIYPQEKETVMHESVDHQIKDWFNFTNSIDNGYHQIMKDVELAFSIFNFKGYNAILSESISDFYKKTLEGNNLEKHPVFSKKLTRIYLGNEFCPRLFPEKELLFRLLNKIISEDYWVSIALPYVREHDVDFFINILEEINNFASKNSKIEIIINDFVIADIISKRYNYLIPVLGRLLNKRKKDPRAKWKINLDKFNNEYEENVLNIDHFEKFLKNLNIERYEFETHLLQNKLPSKNHSLHFPFYQITTGTYCSLYAECVNFYSTSQELVHRCPHYCEEFSQIFPKHIDSIGIGNSIFGYNKSILESSDYLNNSINQGVDRLIYTNII